MTGQFLGYDLLDLEDFSKGAAEVWDVRMGSHRDLCGVPSEMKIRSFGFIPKGDSTPIFRVIHLLIRCIWLILSRFSNVPQVELEVAHLPVKREVRFRKEE